MKLSKSKVFYIFLAVYVLVWFFVQLLRNQPSIDSMEAILWGELLDFGTNKHPPLSGWIMGGFYNLVGQHEQVAYLLGPSCIAIGLFFVYKLAKFFMPEEKAICSAMIMPICFYYTYILFIDNFNCNFLSLAIFPMIAYFYYKSVKGNSAKDWILFGIMSGLGVINKYQVLFLFIPLFIHFIIFERRQFKQKGMYLAIAAGLAVIMPHIIWLFKNDFFSFAYMAEQSGGSEAETTVMLIFTRLFRPLKFIVDQILALSGCIVAYLLLAWQAKNIGFIKEENNISDKVFISCVAFGLVLTQASMGLINGSYIHGIWGSIMVGFFGIALFYFFPIKFNEKSFSFFVKLSYVVMFLWVVAIVIFALLQTKHNISYPYQQNIPVFHKLWEQKTKDAPLKYVGGRLEYIFQFRLFDNVRPQPRVILETFGHKSPWLNDDDVIKSGAMVFAKDPEELEPRVRDIIRKLPEDYEIEQEEYEYEIANRFGKTRKYTVYYAIIPPQKNDL